MKSKSFEYDPQRFPQGHRCRYCRSSSRFARSSKILIQGDGCACRFCRSSTRLSQQNAAPHTFAGAQGQPLHHCSCDWRREPRQRIRRLFQKVSRGSQGGGRFRYPGASLPQDGRCPRSAAGAPFRRLERGLQGSQVRRCRNARTYSSRPTSTTA